MKTVYVYAPRSFNACDRIIRSRNGTPGNDRIEYHSMGRLESLELIPDRSKVLTPQMFGADEFDFAAVAKRKHFDVEEVDS